MSFSYDFHFSNCSLKHKFQSVIWSDHFNRLRWANRHSVYCADRGELVKKSVSLCLYRCTLYLKFIEKTDVFTVNDNFTSKLTRIKILPVSMGRTATEQNQQEQQETRNKVFKWPRYESNVEGIIKMPKIKIRLQITIVHFS